MIFDHPTSHDHSPKQFQQEVFPTPAGRAMYNKLLTMAGLPNSSLHVIRGEGSYSSGHNIYIDASEIRLCGRNLDCIASVAGHEIGHVVLGHTTNMRDDNPRQAEKEADLYSVRLNAKAGFDPCAGAKFFQKLLQTYGDGTDVEHPNPSTRVKYIMEECSRYGGKM